MVVSVLSHTVDAWYGLVGIELNPGSHRTVDELLSDNNIGNYNPDDLPVRSDGHWYRMLAIIAY